jgi:hypothetical protein
MMRKEPARSSVWMSRASEIGPCLNQMNQPQSSFFGLDLLVTSLDHGEKMVADDVATPQQSLM